MNVEITPRRLSGAVTPPPSKSLLHRLIVCGALAEGVTSLHNYTSSEDLKATLACVCALGARTEEVRAHELRVYGRGGKPETRQAHYACGESGTTLRFFLPLSLALTGGGRFTGEGRLLERPLGPFEMLFHEKGIALRRGANELSVSGALPAGDYRLPGDVSSQFFSGLLLALPLLTAPSTLEATTEIESAPYIELTLAAQALADVRSERDAGRWIVAPQSYRPFEAEAEADWSQAAFWLAARMLGSAVSVEGLSRASAQGDRRIEEYAEALSQEGDVCLDVSQCPDLLPPLAAMAALREGSCRIEGAARLRYKESDRLSSVSAALRALGAELLEEPDALEIRGVKTLRGGAPVDCRGDHRVAMMAAVAATRCEKPVLLLGADCVGKSYPAFWRDYTRLGGEIHVL